MCIKTAISCSSNDLNLGQESLALSIEGLTGNQCTGKTNCEFNFRPTSAGSKVATCTVTDLAGNQATKTLTLAINTEGGSSGASSGATTTTIENENEENIIEDLIDFKKEDVIKNEVKEETTVIEKEKQQILKEADQPTQELIKGIIEVPESEPTPVEVKIETETTTAISPSGALVPVTGYNILVKEETKQDFIKLKLEIKIDEKQNIERPTLNSNIEIKTIKKIPPKINIKNTKNMNISIILIITSILVTIFMNFGFKNQNIIFRKR